MDEQGGLHSADSYLKRAGELLQARDLEASRTAFDLAEAAGADPDTCAGGRWQIYMLLGNMGCAWQEADTIRARESPDPHRFWNGSPLQGRSVIVRCLHGLGDTVQMLRYLPALVRQAREVIVEVPPRFLSLLPALQSLQDSRVRWITWGEQAPAIPPVWDVQLEVMELPYIFRSEVQSLPSLQRYVSPPAEEIARVALCLGPSARPRIGLVWTAGEWNQSRAFDHSLLQPLLEHNAHFWSLVHRTSDSELMASSERMRDASVCGDGLLALAAVIANMDLVISTDTLAAHLAGAVGKPVWLMLQFAADWRWMTGTQTSPWYPTMRIFRQPSPGDWSGVIAELGTALQGERVFGNHDDRMEQLP